MLTPGPDHPIMLERPERRWRAYVNYHVIADTDDALILREANLPPVVYFPRGDVAMEYAARTKRTLSDPYKGEAACYTFTIGGDVLEDVAWSFDEPAPAVGALAGRVAFDPGRVEIYDVEDAAVNPHPRERATEVNAETPPRREADAGRAEVDEIVQHTDAGAGESQREHWQPNVETPHRPEGGLR